MKNIRLHRNVLLWMAFAISLFFACEMPINVDPGNGGEPGSGGETEKKVPIGDYSWELIGVLGNSEDEPSNSRPLTIEVDAAGMPIVAYRDTANGNKLSVKKYSGSSWTALGSVGISDGAVRWVSMDVDASDSVIVGYADEAYSGNGTVLKWDSSSWTPLGVKGEAANTSFDFGQVQFSADNSPMTVFAESGKTPASKEWQNAAWEFTSRNAPAAYIDQMNLGNTGWMSLTSWSDVPVLAYQNVDTTIMTLSFKDHGDHGGVSYWRDMSPEGLRISGPTDNSRSYISLAGCGEDLYAALKARSSNEKLELLRWNSKSADTFIGWNVLEAAGEPAPLELSDGVVEYVDIAAHPVNGGSNAIVAFQDVANGKKISVLKAEYAGESSTMASTPGYSYYYVGSKGFTENEADWVSVAAHTDGTIYIAFRDKGNNNAVTVMKSVSGSGGNGTLPAPIAPVNVTISNEKAGSLDVSWDEVNFATAYEIWYGTSNVEADAVQYNAAVSTNSVTITGLTAETDYYIWVKAINSVGASESSSFVKGTTAVEPPKAPTAASVKAGNGSLVVSWTAVDKASSYEVWYSTANVPSGATQSGGDINGTTVTIHSLSNGTLYYIWIKAKNISGTSDFSPSAEAMPMGIGTQVLAPGHNLFMQRAHAGTTVFDGKILFCSGYTHGYGAFHSGSVYASENGRKWLYPYGESGPQGVNSFMFNHNGKPHVLGYTPPPYKVAYMLWEMNPVDLKWSQKLSGTPELPDVNMSISNAVSFKGTNDTEAKIYLLAQDKVYKIDNNMTSEIVDTNVLNGSGAGKPLPFSSYAGYIFTYQSKLWYMPALMSIDSIHYPANAIYSSTDGINWTEVRAGNGYGYENSNDATLVPAETQAAAVDHFFGRYGHNVVVYDPDGSSSEYSEMLFLLNGVKRGLASEGYKYTNEVFYSYDGSIWKKYSGPGVDWPGRASAGTVVFDEGSGEAIWMVNGGLADFVQTNDVWRFKPDTAHILKANQM